MERMWEIPHTQPRLAKGTVHVWKIDLSAVGGSRLEVETLLVRAYAVLSLEERARAARTRQGLPREEFVVGRGCLRQILATETNADAKEIILEVDGRGKLRLPRSDGLSFNVAHSQGFVLLALSRAGAVGVDVEAVHAPIEVMEVASAALHPRDVARLGALGGLEQVEEFYRCWARREAVAKADGRGLTASADEWEVGGPGSEAGDYFVQDLAVGKSHRAALATQQADVEIRLLETRFLWPKVLHQGLVIEASVTSR